jgi:hypothetical protein
MGGNQTDGEYIARMQKAENVNQILSKILRDVISKHPSIAEEVRKELEIAFEIMTGKHTDIVTNTAFTVEEDEEQGS